MGIKHAARRQTKAKNDACAVLNDCGIQHWIFNPADHSGVTGLHSADELLDQTLQRFL